MKHFLLLFSLACAAIQLGAPSRADGHGFAGARFFPATLTTEDPFIADELSLPTISTIRTPEDGGTRETEFSADIAKSITPNFGLEIGEAFTALNPHEGETVNGFGNLELGAKYQILKSDPHEAIVSLGLEAEVGGTGSSSVDADSFSTWAPGILFGKGFGDLPEGLRFLKPFALTGTAGIAIPTSASTRSVDDRRGDRRTGSRSRATSGRTGMGFCAGIQHPIPPIAGAGHALARALRSPDSTGRVRSRNSVEPWRRWTNDRDDQSRGNLGGSTFSVWSGGDYSDQRTHWQ